MPHEPTFVFVDEAGNTGTNFLDDDQRWYVLAGIAVSGMDVDGARSRVDALRTRLGVKELKGSGLLTRQEGREHVREALRIVGASGCIPFFAVLEKRFNLAGRFDQIVSDPNANPDVSWAQHLDRDARRSAAATMTRLPIGTLLTIQQSLRNPMTTDWKALIEEVSAGLRGLGEPNLAAEVEGARNASLEDLFGPNPAFDAKDMSVNEAAFTTLVQLIDQAAVDAGITELRLVHDETASFRATFEAVFGRLRTRAADAAPVFDAYGNKVWPLQAIRDLSFSESHDEPLVQAADVHAALLSWLCAMHRPESFAGEEGVKESAELVTAMFLKMDPRLIHPLVSDDDLARIGRTLSILRGGA